MTSCMVAADKHLMMVEKLKAENKILREALKPVLKVKISNSCTLGLLYKDDCADAVYAAQKIYKDGGL